MTDYNRTYLAVDFGTRRIGIAKSDPTGLIASALETLEVRSMKDAVEKTVALLHEYEPVGLVVGYPLLTSGDRSAKCDEIDNFIAKVTRLYPVDVYKVDERYTSQEAAGVIHAHGKRTGQDKKRIDRIAAVIILQRFLDESGADRKTE
jgi:putative Holliday junction resolvase